jgi:putative peptidoglycan binding protein
MKTKGLVFVSCLAAGALITSPAIGKPTKKTAGSSSRPQRMTARTTQVTPSYRYQQSMSSRMGGARYYGGTRYSGTRFYAGGQYSGTGYYNGTPRYGANTSYYRYGSNYYGGTQYYYGGGYPYESSSVWPYVAASVAPYVASSLSYPYSYYGGYPYNSSYYGGYPYNNSYYGGYPYNYSYYGSGYGYGYAGSTVASVQRRLGEFGYYHGVVDGVIGPRTRSAIAAFESRNGLAVDGTISRPLLNRLGLA